MKKNIIFLSLLCSIISLQAMDTYKRLESTFDESSGEALLRNTTAASSTNSEQRAAVTLNRNLPRTQKKIRNTVMRQK